MPKYQQRFYEYLAKLEEFEKEYPGNDYVKQALSSFYKYWKLYERDGVKDSMRMAMDATVSFVGLPVKVHLN